MHFGVIDSQSALALNLYFQKKKMQKLAELKKHVQNGNLQIAQMNSDNRPVNVPFQSFESKAKDMNKHSKIYKLLEGLTWEEKYEWVNTRRLRANQMYKENDIDSALETYLESLIGLERNSPSEEKNERIKIELQFPILMNMASCFYRKKQFQKGVDLCDQILNISKYSKHPQALFKKANFQYQLGQYEESIKNALNLREITKADTYQGKICLNDVNQLLRKSYQKSKANSEFYRKIFADDYRNTEPQESKDEEAIIHYEQKTLKSIVDVAKKAAFYCFQRCCPFLENQKYQVGNQEESQLLLNKSQKLKSV